MSEAAIESSFATPEQEKEHLLSNDNFEKLKSIQKKIESETQVIPTFKKIINMLFKDDVLNDVQNQLIEKLR